MVGAARGSTGLIASAASNSRLSKDGPALQVVRRAVGLS